MRTRRRPSTRLGMAHRVSLVLLGLWWLSRPAYAEPKEATHSQEPVNLDEQDATPGVQAPDERGTEPTRDRPADTPEPTDAISDGVVAPRPRFHPTPEPQEAPQDPGAGQRVVGIEIGAVGLAGITVGTIFGLVAKSKWDDSNSGSCSAADRCNGRGLSLRQDAVNAATISTIAFVSGGVALAGGIAIVLTAPRAATNISLALTPTSTGATGFFRAAF